MQKITRITYLLVLVLLGSAANAQFIKEKSVNAQIGFGLSAPYDSSTDVVDDGFFAQGELILKVTSWVELRPYLGLIITNSTGEDINGRPTSEKAESKAALVGGKVRLRAPIPWVAPYIEIGVGTSIGQFTTMTTFDNINKSGVIYHTPVALGFEFGRRHNVDIGLAYYYQPSVKQYVGAIAVGVTIPLKGPSK